ncbi:T-cell surface glycoprotein CD3 delta chain-like isoform X2 [Carcharodon carcharias]|uniref:T-cell surface glycoprotein CD3 delta chain-like isoform X2 n=1 Tax=Carcharodon carcharias TaxID=13397 RepID=UPI001B7F74D0|nr:T-cell surface glycoprotein CD3 delta chain-like isoform X2 [Carcharodon carcharias]XP_041029990.1 T-cell surface glycoprotein CD3 delta chain-like isoform X2 [Carcharodon carcharias]
MRCHVQLIIVTIVTILLFGDTDAEITLNSVGRQIELHCVKGNVKIRKAGESEMTETSSKSVKISKLTENFFGEYSCVNDSQRAIIFIKSCQNCVDFDSGSIVGIVVGDLIAIVLIAVAVYSISTPAKGKIHRASDRQALVLNDEANPVYTGIQKVDRQEYSELEHRSKK